MGIYTPRKVPQILTAAWLNEELHAIQTAHNSHSKENFPDKSVPLSALQNRYAYFTETLLVEETDGSDLCHYTVPVDCTLVKYSACAAFCSSTSTFYLGYYPVDSYGASGSLVNLVAATSFVSANNVLSGTLSTTLYPGYIIVTQMTDGGGTGTDLKRPTVCLVFKTNHTS